MRTRVLLFAVFTLLASAAVNAQSLPAEAKSALTKSFPGWKLAPKMSGLGEAVENTARGDFNGDGKGDYLAKIISGGKGHVVALIASGRNYRAFTVRTESAQGIKNLRVNVSKKGEGYYENVGDETPTMKLPTDGIFTCWDGTDDCGTFLFRNGKFRLL